MMSLNAAALSTSAPCSFCSPGSVTSRAVIATAMCIAVGKVSFDDWPMLTWSFGCTGCFEPISPPSISIARFEITSLAFMFDWVPEPVCQTTSGKWSSQLARRDLRRRRRDRLAELRVEVAASPCSPPPPPA